MSNSLATRKTKARIKVEEIVSSTKHPISLKDIFTEVQKQLPKTAYSTVFRLVEKLESEKLITKVNWKDRGGVYEWANRPHHHHLVCEKCDVVEDISDTLLCYNESKVTKDTGFIITHHAIELTGICKPCQRKK